MRRLVIGIMLALFAVGAYSQGYKDKMRHITGMEYFKIQTENMTSFRKDIVGEWRTDEGKLVTIRNIYIDIEDVVKLNKSYCSEIWINDGLYTITGWYFDMPHPFLKDVRKKCEIEIRVYSEDHISLAIEDIGYSDSIVERVKIYRLTRVK